MNNKEFLQEFFMVRNHSKQTQRAYICAINKYTQLCGKTMEELIEEAEKEEEQGIRWKRRTLKRRLLTFRHYLIENYRKNTVQGYFISVKAVYNYYEIEIGELTRPNLRSFNTPGDPTFDELPTHEEISQVMHVAPLWFQAVLVFMTSSGCARRETMEMTVGAFKKATYPFHRKNDIIEALNVLKDLDNVIPTFKLKRKKTNKYYYTFCSPEAVSKIVRYNEEFDFGHASDGLNRFRSHMMRKFHSNHLKKSGMSESDIDALQGRGKSTTRAAYFFDDPKILLKKYVEHFQCLLIEKTVNNIDWKSPEYQELEARLSTIENILLDKDESRKDLLDYYSLEE